jgi:hypothetical protein
MRVEAPEDRYAINNYIGKMQVMTKIYIFLLCNGILIHLVYKNKLMTPMPQKVLQY